MTTPPVETLDAMALARLMRAGKVVLVDVREPNEFVLERIPGALLFPLSSFDPEALPADGDRQVIFHCAGGKRSLDAAQRRLGAGAGRAAHLGGGIAAWKAAGLPVVTAAGVTGAWPG